MICRYKNSIAYAIKYGTVTLKNPLVALTEENDVPIGFHAFTVNANNSAFHPMI